jgi:hypothetical protein
VELNRRRFLASIAAAPLMTGSIPRPTQHAIDPPKEARAEQIAVRSGFKSRSECAWEQVTFRVPFTDLVLGEPVQLTAPGVGGELVVTGMDLTREFDIVVTAQRRVQL